MNAGDVRAGGVGCSWDFFERCCSATSAGIHAGLNQARGGASATQQEERATAKEDITKGYGLESGHWYL